MRRRWDHRGAGTAITLSKPTAHADGVPADPHEVGSAPGDSQSNGNETESRTLIEPANRGADTPSRTDTDVIGDEESLAVTDPRGDHPDPDSHCSAESVDCHPVGDYQPIADCKPVADCPAPLQARRRPRPRRTSLPKQAQFPGFGGRLRVYCLQPR